MTADRITSRRIAAIFFTALGAAMVIGPVNAAFAQTGNGSGAPKASATKAFAQAKSKRPRARPRIRVTPVYPYRLETLPYPPPYEYEYPGPNAVRQCTARLVQEFRPSGTVIVPRTTCWWERG